MLLNLYILIIIIAVQSKVCGRLEVSGLNPISSRQNFLQNSENPYIHNKYRRSRGNVKNFHRHSQKPIQRIDSEVSNVKMFDSIREFQLTTRTTTMPTTKVATPDINLIGIKNVLLKIVRELDHYADEKKRQCEATPSTKEKVANTKPKPSEAKHRHEGAKANYPESHSILDVFKGKSKEKGGSNKKAKWGEWTDWSACSVTCGKGREIRWRHCKEDCDDVETEMEEKTCQLPACGPGKLFGVINL